MKEMSAFVQSNENSNTTKDIDMEILFCVEYYTTCNISPIEFLLRQTRINKHLLKQRVSQHAHI